METVKDRDERLKELYAKKQEAFSKRMDAETEIGRLNFEIAILSTGISIGDIIEDRKGYERLVREWRDGFYGSKRKKDGEWSNALEYLGSRPKLIRKAE